MYGFENWKNVTNKNVTRWVDNQIYNRPLHFDLQNEPPQENARDSRPEPSRYDCYSHFSPGRLLGCKLTQTGFACLRCTGAGCM
jgi:hypothetical protein